MAAVTKAVFNGGITIHKRLASLDASSKLHMGGADASVDNVGVDIGTVDGASGVGIVQGQVHLVDAVKAPGANINGSDMRVFLHKIHHWVTTNLAQQRR